MLLCGSVIYGICGDEIAEIATRYESDYFYNIPEDEYKYHTTGFAKLILVTYYFLSGDGNQLPFFWCLVIFCTIFGTIVVLMNSIKKDISDFWGYLVIVLLIVMYFIILIWGCIGVLFYLSSEYFNVPSLSATNEDVWGTMWCPFFLTIGLCGLHLIAVYLND